MAISRSLCEQSKEGVVLPMATVDPPRTPPGNPPGNPLGPNTDCGLRAVSHTAPCTCSSRPAALGGRCRLGSPGVAWVRSRVQPAGADGAVPVALNAAARG